MGGSDGGFPNNAVATSRVRAPRGARAAKDAIPVQPTIVHATAEFSPYARTGGLGEAVAGLASYQASARQQVVVFMPLYRSVREVARDLESTGPTHPITIGGRTEEVRFYRAPVRLGRPQVIFVDAPRYFDRPGIYSDASGGYPDNHLRFGLFSRAVIHGIAELVPGDVVLQAHDWHAALIPVYLHTDPVLAGRVGPTPVVLSVHNAGYQGDFPPETITDLGLSPELYSIDHLESYGRLNFLKGGLTFCDMAVTVSPTHARELCTEEGAFGLHETFRRLGSRFVGISNGIDETVWDPTTDQNIEANYSSGRLRGKATCKEALQRTMGLPERADVPLFGMSTRVVSQKGFDLILRSDRIRRADAQFVFIGRGDPWYENALMALAAERPDVVRVELGFTDELEHVLMAGVDIYLMPSLYEPCGLSQMRAQRYGAPVVGRRVGGIGDTVSDGATGFLFDAYDATALDATIDRALAAFADRKGWTAMMRQAMACEFGWDRSAAQYARVLDGAARLATASG